jgi:hypothetical protein
MKASYTKVASEPMVLIASTVRRVSPSNPYDWTTPTRANSTDNVTTTTNRRIDKKMRFLGILHQPWVKLQLEIL